MAQEDIFLVPEGWPNALVLGFRARCRTVVYCQNWAYLFHGLEAGVRWRDLPEGLQVAIAHHHNPQADLPYADEVALIHSANALSKKVEPGHKLRQDSSAVPELHPFVAERVPHRLSRLEARFGPLDVRDAADPAGVPCLRVLRQPGDRARGRLQRLLETFSVATEEDERTR